MKVILDTTICIAIIKGKASAVLGRLTGYEVGEVGISSVTLAELEFGVQKSPRAQENQAALEEFVLPLCIADFDAEAAKQYGLVRAMLEKKGSPIGALDTMIAAHALSLSAELATNNKREFARVKGLVTVDWLGHKA